MVNLKYLHSDFPGLAITVREASKVSMQLKISIPVHTKGITMTGCIAIFHLKQ
jgi:hypothetical protein